MTGKTHARFVLMHEHSKYRFFREKRARSIANRKAFKGIFPYRLLVCAQVSALLYGNVISFVGDTLVAEIDPAKLPKSGAKVFYNNNDVGRVTDIIGNIKKPYCIIRVSNNVKERDTLVGKKVSFGG